MVKYPCSNVVVLVLRSDSYLNVEPVFRQAEKACSTHSSIFVIKFLMLDLLQEWKDWVEAFTPILCEVDDQIPELPAKDVIYRIYRDVITESLHPIPVPH